MPVVHETPEKLLAVQALAAMGKGDTEIARTLRMDRSTAWRLRHKELLQPELLDHAAKTLANKMILSATAALDSFLDKAEANELGDEPPGALIKMASTAMESASLYAAHSGTSSIVSDLAAQLGIVQSHSVSRMTLEQKITVESASKAEPLDIDCASIQTAQAPKQARAKK
jgi:hypothetical protein